ncbi:MAG: hypothetical protein DMG06_31085 [Acidobacteria bacterium]|nr:MAG: hypothetical protein DMG06_31085 [Acidobacteriota bacterium]
MKNNSRSLASERISRRKFLRFSSASVLAGSTGRLAWANRVLPGPQV